MRPTSLWGSSIYATPFSHTYTLVTSTDDAGFLIPWKAPAVFGMNLLPPQAFSVSAELAATLFVVEEFHRADLVFVGPVVAQIPCGFTCWAHNRIPPIYTRVHSVARAHLPVSGDCSRHVLTPIHMLSH